MISNWYQNPRLTLAFRIILIIVGIIFVALTVAFQTRSDLARTIWPWSYLTLSPLSYTFLASITIAIAVPVLWIGFTGEIAATFGGAINLAITFTGSTIFILQDYAATQREELLTAAVVCGALALISMAACVMTWSIPFKDDMPMPRVARTSFSLLAASLVTIGSGLAFKEQLFPWRLSTEAGVIYGWIFLGAAAYFWFGFIRPVWGNATGQYLGFLAYDLILLVPFIQHLSDVQPDDRLSLYIYLAVIVLTAVQAIYYLFIAPKTRLWRRVRAQPQPLT